MSTLLTNEANMTGMRITEVNLHYPPKRKSDALIAYSWVRLEDGLGHGVIVSGIRLLSIRGEYHVAMPNDPKKDSCPQCNGRNIQSANYCNWCSRPLVPAPSTERHDRVAPVNSESRALFHDAILEEHFRQEQERKEAAQNFE